METSIYVTVINSDAEWDSSDPDAPCVGGFSTGLTARSLQLNESERESVKAASANGQNGAPQKEML